MHEFYASARGADTLVPRGPIQGGLGSARCRKICSLKRHVPFDALYIIHKVAAVAVPRAPSPYLGENAERSISRSNFDHLRRTPAFAISIIVAHRLYIYVYSSLLSSISTFATPGIVRANTHPLAKWDFCLRDFDTLSVSFPDYYASRSTRQIAGRTGCRGTRHADALLA